MDAQIFPQCPEEQDTVLGDEGEPAPQDIEPDVADVVTVDVDLPRLQFDHPIVFEMTNNESHSGRYSPEESL